jgi:hypothetical protein
MCVCVCGILSRSFVDWNVHYSSSKVNPRDEVQFTWTVKFRRRTAQAGFCHIFTECDGTLHFVENLVQIENSSSCLCVCMEQI